MKTRLQGTVCLPGSKSESNRALMIAAYGGFPLAARNLSDAHDTVLLKALLKQVDNALPSDKTVVDCEDAGTVARFMMTYLACKPGTWRLEGTERLCQRPMAPLIESLRYLGADITCTDTQGGLPVVIHGHPIRGGVVALDASLSSQFASSLLMAAPTWTQGLRLSLRGEPVSMPYLEMTLQMMRRFGAGVLREGKVITIQPQPYRPEVFDVEADWSAASYWYEMVALSENGNLLLKGLRRQSLQGDSAVAGLFAKLGVETEYTPQGAVVSKSGNLTTTPPEPIVFDFKDTPDLFPSILVTCVALNIKSVFFGITTLYHKESDRINSLITELSKLYKFNYEILDDKIIIDKSILLKENININDIVFKTYDDHRIAMSLASLAPLVGGVKIEGERVVNKSYPGFWKEFESFFQII